MLTEFNWKDAIGSSPIFLVLIGCSIVTLGVALERAYYFWKREGKPDKTLSRCLMKIRSGDFDSAEAICESSSHPLSAVALEIFRKAAGHFESLEERMQIVLSQQKLLLERNLNVLGTMAAIAPLIGLLGTVWGIMRAFQNMAQTGSAAPTVVAAGVAEALITTAAGLIVAVPALILYNHFSRRMNVMLTVAENHSRTIRTAMLNMETGEGHHSSLADGSYRDSNGRPPDARRSAVDPAPALSR
jgi:biopolymer transport protein ExbB